MTSQNNADSAAVHAVFDAAKSTGAWDICADDLTQIAGLVGAWNHFGCVDPTPKCVAIPPLGERSGEAARSGHDAVEAIDRLTRNLHGLRSLLVNELGKSADMALRRAEETIARIKSGPPAELRPCNSPDFANDNGDSCVKDKKVMHSGIKGEG